MHIYLTILTFLNFFFKENLTKREEIFKIHDNAYAIYYAKSRMTAFHFYEIRIFIVNFKLRMREQ